MVADLACANGRFTKSQEQIISLFQKNNPSLQAKVLGLDISEELIKIAKSTNPDSNIGFFVQNALHLSSKISESSLDIITAAGLVFYLEHNIIEKFIEEVSKCLSRNGRFYFNLIHPNLFEENSINNQISPTWLKLESLGCDKYQMHHWDSLGANSDPEVFRHSASYINQLLLKEGLQIIEVQDGCIPIQALFKNSHLKDLDLSQIEAISKTPMTLLFTAEKL